MPAAQPKEGIGFELHVAAALKTEPQKLDGRSLDLTEFYFNINPRTYPRGLTKAGYDVTVDITASKDNVEYLIECKSSKHRDQILDLNDSQFLKSMLEFLALEMLSEQTKWDFCYILATNYPVAKEIATLGQEGSTRQVERLRNALIGFGCKEHGETFNSGATSARRIVKVLRTLVCLELPDQYLRLKMSSDSEYRKNYETFSSRLKHLDLTLSQDGPAQVRRFQTVSFLCKSSSHEKCRNIPTDGMICHVGNIDSFTSELEPFRKRNETGIRMIRASQLGFSVNDVDYPRNVSTKEVSESITIALNSLIGDACLLYIVPGTFDVLLIDKEIMVEKIKRCFDLHTLKYELDTVKEMRGLGASLKISAARFILSSYHLSCDEDDFISNEDANEHDV